MGISGLLPFLKKASRPIHVRDLSHSTVAIDVYCWLHKGAFGCAEKLVLGQPTNGYVLYVMKYIDLLLHHRIKPVMVFDGRNLPSKAGTEKKRRENRSKYRQMAKDFLREGKGREARECFQRCVDITPEMALEVIKACQERNVDCIVAPYEADAQLAFLNLHGLADAVISEDSDLTLFGCEKILFKLDAAGNGVLYEKDQLSACLGQKADSFNFDKFRYMCILSGCDYLPSLHGIGLGKSLKFWSKVTNPNLKQVLPKVPSYLNMHQLNVTQEYIDGFIQANNTFLYQLVYDSRRRKLRPLTMYPSGATAEDFYYAGEMLNSDKALQLSLGNLNLRDLELVNDFNPEGHVGSSNPVYGKRANHDSIWNPDFDLKKIVLSGDSAVESASLDKSSLSSVIHTAFGDVKKKDSTVSTVSERRKRTLELTMDLARKSPVVSEDEEVDEEEDLNESADSAELSEIYGGQPPAKKIKFEPTRTSSKSKYVSRYFVKEETKSAVKEAEDIDADTLIEDLPSPKKPSVAATNKENKGSWFSDLDSIPDLKSKFIYRTNDIDDLEPRKKESPTLHFGPSKLDEGSLKSSEASRKAFKPVALNDDAKKSIRNPFAKKKTTETPVKEAAALPDQASSQESSLGFSQASLNSLDNESFQFSATLVAESELSSSQASSQEKDVEEDSGSASKYFQPKNTIKSMFAKTKPKGVSGLMKTNKGGAKQRNLLDMWSKK